MFVRYVFFLCFVITTTYFSKIGHVCFDGGCDKSIVEVRVVSGRVSVGKLAKGDVLTKPGSSCC